MSIVTNKRIICNECNYEHPNDYYFGVKTWIFALIDDEELHFCCQDCLKAYVKDYEFKSNQGFWTREVKDNSKEMRDILA